MLVKHPMYAITKTRLGITRDLYECTECNWSFAAHSMKVTGKKDTAHRVLQLPWR